MTVTQDSLTPGDLVVLTNKRGGWYGSYEYVGPDTEAPDRLYIRDTGGRRTLFSVHPDFVIRPRVLGTGDVGQASPSEAGRASVADDDSITAAQRRKLFALGTALDLGLDDLRALTPSGSISMLTRTQASELIDRLSGREDGRRRAFADQGTASGRQLGLIAHLRDLIGFREAGFGLWLEKRFKVGSIEEIDDGALAHRVIGGLTRMYDNRRRASGGGPKKRFDRASRAL